MRIYYAKPDAIIYFLNETEEGKQVNENIFGEKYEFIPINSPNTSIHIIKLYKQDVVSWGGKTFNASNRGSFQVFISLHHNIMFGFYGDDLITHEDESGQGSGHGSS